VSVVIHVRIPRRVKERLEELGVNISEEVRRLLELRLRQLEARRVLEEIRRELEGSPRARDSAALIR
jgi:hypothetical protein